MERRVRYCRLTSALLSSAVEVVSCNLLPNVHTVLRFLSLLFLLFVEEQCMTHRLPSPHNGEQVGGWMMTVFVLCKVEPDLIGSVSSSKDLCGP